MKFSAAETVTMVTIADAFPPQHPAICTVTAPPPQLYSYCTALRYSFCDARRTQTSRAHTRARTLHAVYKSAGLCARAIEYNIMIVRVCTARMSVRVWALARMGGAGARPITAPNRGFYYCHRAATRRSPAASRRPAAAARDRRSPTPWHFDPTTTIIRNNIL